MLMLEFDILLTSLVGFSRAHTPNRLSVRMSSELTRSSPSAACSRVAVRI